MTHQEYLQAVERVKSGVSPLAPENDGYLDHPDNCEECLRDIEQRRANLVAQLSDPKLSRHDREIIEKDRRHRRAWHRPRL